MKSINLVWLTVVVFSLPSAHADSRHRRGQECKIIPETRVARSQVVSGGDCVQDFPLQLIRVTQTYPAMGDTVLEVDAWQGSYQKTVTMQDDYETDFVDPCTGALVDQKFFTGSPYASAQEFAIVNPNLSDTVSNSFTANAPLTNREAEAALNAAKEQCEASVTSNQ